LLATPVSRGVLFAGRAVGSMATMFSARPILTRDLSALALSAIAGFTLGYWQQTVATVDRRA